MPQTVLTVSRGCVLTLQELTEPIRHMDQNGDTEKTNSVLNQSKLVSYTYDSSVTKFVKSTEQEVGFVADQIIARRNVEDFESGTVQPCILVKVGVDTKHHSSSSKLKEKALRSYFEYQVLLLQDNSKFVESGSFSCGSSLLKCSVWLLSGPTICWQESGKLFIAKTTHNEPSVYVVEQMPEHLWGLETRLKWCSATKEHLVLMATDQSKDVGASNVWFDDLNSEKWILSQCPRLEIKKGEIITDLSPIPHPYASIVNSISIIDKFSGQAVALCKRTNPKALILATTTQGQLLAFSCGKVQLVCDLPFRDACDIAVVSRCEGEDLVVVKSKSGTVCAVGRNSFQIIQQWDNVSSVYVDDFLFNGGEQMLLISAGVTDPLQDFILTDLDGCYINDKESKPLTTHGGASESASSTCDDNLMSAIKALEARLQSALGSLRRAECKYDDKKKLIEESQHALVKMVNGQENGMFTKDQRHLVCLYDGSSTQSQGHQQDGVSMVTKETEDITIDVANTWQRVIDRQWVVGVPLRNRSDRMLENLMLCLIPVNSGKKLNHKLDPVTSECKVQFPGGPSKVKEAQKVLSNKANEPSRKKQKLNTKNSDAQNAPVWLEPGAETDVITVATLPAFAGYSVVCCELVIQWRELNTGYQKMDDKEDKTACWSERVKCCGRVWLSAADVASNKLAIELTPSNSRPVEQFHQDIQALGSIQMSTALVMTSIHSNLSCVSTALKSQLGFIRCEAVHDGMMICPSSGVLWSVRVKVVVRESCNGKLTVWTRDKQQLMLFCHSLQHQLPDDISINPPQLPLNKIEESIARCIQSMKQEITSHVTGLQTLQQQSMVKGQDEEVMEVEQTEGTRSDPTEADKLADVRKKFRKEHTDMSDNEILHISKDNVKTFEVGANDYKQRTDISVRTMARNSYI